MQVVPSRTQRRVSRWSLVAVGRAREREQQSELGREERTGNREPMRTRKVAGASEIIIVDFVFVRRGLGSVGEDGSEGDGVASVKRRRNIILLTMFIYLGAWDVGRALCRVYRRRSSSAFVTTPRPLHFHPSPGDPTSKAVCMHAGSVRTMSFSSPCLIPVNSACYPAINAHVYWMCVSRSGKEVWALGNEE